MFRFLVCILNCFFKDLRIFFNKLSGLGSSFNDTKKYDTRNQNTTENFYQEPKEEIPDSGDYDFGYFDDIPDNSATDNDWTYGTRYVKNAKIVLSNIALI